MRNGIEAATLLLTLPFAEAINQACERPGHTQSPLLCYAIAWRESIEEYGSGAATVLSDNGDGGHGLFQITEPPIPHNWQSAYVNACHAIDDFITPAETFWATFEQGEALVKCIAAEFNAGRSQALEGHEQGDVDMKTTDDYAAAVLGFYQHLVLTGHPV